MDVTSYLLGKNAGGGGSTINNQNKSVSITENGSTSVTADEGYTGLGTVSITANVQPDLESKSVTITENTTTTITPTTGKDGLSSVEITTNVGGGSSDYFNDFINSSGESGTGLARLVKNIPNDITIQTNTLSYCFKGATALRKVPLFDMSNVQYANSMFYSCQTLTSIPAYNTSSLINAREMFYMCVNLTTIPVFNFASISGTNSLTDIFGSCRAFTDTSLDNVLQSCITAVSYTGTKTLAKLGFNSSSYAASRIEALPHYQDFINAGWTIGY